VHRTLHHLKADPMPRQPASHRYNTLSMTLHWLMLLLFIGVYSCIELKGFMPRGSTARSVLLGLHGLFGLWIFVLVWVRLLGRLKPAPAIVPKPPTWQTAVAQLMHLALYGLMIGTPMLAWLMLSAGGKPVPYFGFFLPSPLAVNPALASQLKGWHEWLGNLGYWLIGAHAVAGLAHHYVAGDNTLKRMLPGRGQQARGQGGTQ
jgi:cytochrome b561